MITQPLTEDEIKRAFGGLGETSPAWRALMSVLDAESETEILATAFGQLTDAQRHYNAGRLARSLDTIQFFEDLMKQLKQEDLK